MKQDSAAHVYSPTAFSTIPIPEGTVVCRCPCPPIQPPKRRPPLIECPVPPFYENISSQILEINSVPADHVINPEWLSQRYERIERFPDRRHPPAPWEFHDARLWPRTSQRDSMERKCCEIAGQRSRAGCDVMQEVPHQVARVAKRKSGKPEKSIFIKPDLPPYKMPTDIIPGLYPNLWCRRWNASLNDDPISTCMGCGCFVQPPVTDKSYLNLDRVHEICHNASPCYYSGHSDPRGCGALPPVAQPPSSTLTWTTEDIHRCRALPRWWILFERKFHLPKPMDYTKLRPRPGTTSCQSRFEAGELSKVDTQWIR